jgi:proteasome lid subunit RPN8/RPN11
MYSMWRTKLEKIIIYESVLDKFAEKAEDNPLEVCGIITGKMGEASELHMIDNISDYKKEVDYVMDPQQMYNVMKDTTQLHKNTDVDMMSIIHSHPTGMPCPSQIDINRVAYPIPYIIYSCITGEFRAWLMTKAGNVTEVHIEEIENDNS